MKRLVLIFLIAMGLWWISAVSPESRLAELPVRENPLLPEESRDLASQTPDEVFADEPAPTAPVVSMETVKTDPRGFPVSKIGNRARSKTRKASSLSLYRQGLRIDNGGTSYGVLTLRAIPVEDYKETMGPSVEERQGFVYYQPLQPSPDPLSLKDGFPVFEKGSSGLLGFWTGVFHVRLTAQGQPQALANKYGLDLRSFDSSLRWAALRSAQTPDLQSLLSHLKAEPTVTDASLEIVFALKESR